MYTIPACVYRFHNPQANLASTDDKQYSFEGIHIQQTVRTKASGNTTTLNSTDDISLLTHSSDINLPCIHSHLYQHRLLVKCSIVTIVIIHLRPPPDVGTCM